MSTLEPFFICHRCDSHIPSSELSSILLDKRMYHGHFHVTQFVCKTCTGTRAYLPNMIRYATTISVKDILLIGVFDAIVRYRKLWHSVDELARTLDPDWDFLTGKKLAKPTNLKAALVEQAKAHSSIFQLHDDSSSRVMMTIIDPFSIFPQYPSLGPLLENNAPRPEKDVSLNKILLKLHPSTLSGGSSTFSPSPKGRASVHNTIVGPGRPQRPSRPRRAFSPSAGGREEEANEEEDDDGGINSVLMDDSVDLKNHDNVNSGSEEEEDSDDLYIPPDGSSGVKRQKPPAKAKKRPMENDPLAEPFVTNASRDSKKANPNASAPKGFHAQITTPGKFATPDSTPQENRRKVGPVASSFVFDAEDDVQLPKRQQSQAKPTPSAAPVRPQSAIAPMTPASVFRLPTPNPASVPVTIQQIQRELKRLDFELQHENTPMVIRLLTGLARYRVTFDMLVQTGLGRTVRTLQSKDPEVRRLCDGCVRLWKNVVKAHSLLQFRQLPQQQQQQQKMT